METKQKLEILRKLDTNSLIDKIHQYEDELETAMRDDTSYKDLNYEYLASGTNDCQAIKIILAELLAQAPETNEEGSKKLTVADKEAWLTRQRKENQELSGAINRQKNTAFSADNNQITIEMAKKRLESAKAVLNLKTSQINFLAS